MTANPRMKGELLGRKLRRLRKERKLSPAEVAARSGVDPQDLARIERGEARVGLETLFRLLAAFEVDANELESLVADERSEPGPAERFRRELGR
jgi:transcriptional regulator with XRE-family HTH domain